jgi:hypothetical protein
MNERIKELMPKPWTFPYPDRELYTKEQFEKFAELIVRECAHIAWLNSTEDNISHTVIKQHFGVEE